jgi:hypothetical protein
LVTVDPFDQSSLGCGRLVAEVGGIGAAPLAGLVFVLGLIAQGAMISAKPCNRTLEPTNIEASHVLAGFMKMGDGVVEPREVLLMGFVEPILAVLLDS